MQNTLYKCRNYESNRNECVISTEPPELFKTKMHDGGIKDGCFSSLYDLMDFLSVWDIVR